MRGRSWPWERGRPAPAPSGGDAAVRMFHVSKSYSAGSFALHDVSLEVRRGEFVFLTGPSGAGKTTLLRVVAGLAPLDAGRVSLHGTVLDDPAEPVWVPSAARRVGYVFQDYVLFPHLSALDNVAFGLRTNGLARTEARERATVWLERLGLAGLASTRPAALSGGQAQRVALARTLAAEPAALLLDEPLAALDPDTRGRITTELEAVLGSFAGPAVLVSHDRDDTATLCDRTVHLEDGRIAEGG